MAAQELRWLTYLLTDLGEVPRSPPVLYVDNKAMLALCLEHRLEQRTNHIALRYFLARELQQRGQLRLAYAASRANTADVLTKALQPSKTYTARIGERILWDLHEDKDVYNEMWQIPVVPMPRERQVAASVSTKGEAVGSGDGANGRAKEKEPKKCNLVGTSKLGEHKESNEAAKEQRKGEENPKAAAEEEYGESISEATAKAPLDEVVMDVVPPLKLGAAGAD
ncbi:unnamed protein product [Closterium sp. NIES-53]